MAPSKASFLLIAASLVGALACDDSAWHGSHDEPTTLVAGRPECPVAWAGTAIPLWRDTTKRTAAGLAVTAPAFSVPASGLSVPGPITDIPEFHDCQRFIRADGQQYDPLFAVFAAVSLDSIGTALAFDEVTWTSSSGAVATVAATGVVTAVTAGNATIRATSTTDPSRFIAVSVSVVNGMAESGQDSVHVMSGHSTTHVMHPGETLALFPVLGPTTTSTIAVGEIYTYGPGYTPLGIGPNFSCLYLYFNTSQRLVGKVVPIADLGSDAAACVTASNPNSAPGTELTVVRTAEPRQGDFPAAARWDYDAANQQYYVGIKCGAGWCEVGAPGRTRPFTPSRTFVARASTPPGDARVLTGKGWHDTQELAVEDAAGNSIPSGIVGTVIPHPDLESYDMDTFKKWTLVAYVGLDVTNAKSGAVDHYKQKFNYDPVPVDPDLNKLNTVWLCYGSRFTCSVPRPGAAKGCMNGALDLLFTPKRLWVKLRAADGGRVLYRCGIRREHSGPADAKYIMPTARWRWLAMDETIWEYCAAAGCCETAGNGTSGGWGGDN